MLEGESSQDEDSIVHLLNAELSEHATNNSAQVTLPEDQYLMTLLSDSGYNWFEFISILEQSVGEYHIKNSYGHVYKVCLASSILKKRDC